MLSKFLNTKTLIVLLVIFLGIYLVTRLTEKKEDRSFKSQLVEIDTSQVTRIEVVPKIGGGDIITMERSGPEWTLKSAGKSYKPDVNTIKNILNELNRMRTERVAATDPSKWKEYEVTDSTATQVKIYDDGDLLTDIYLGKFSYSQAPNQQQNPYQRQQAKMSTSVRLAGEDKVYNVEGFIKMNIQPKVDTYRAKTLCAVPKDDITRVTFDYPGIDNFTVTNENGKYMVNGQPADSSATARYLMKLAKLTSSSFVDDVEPTTNVPAYTVKVEGNNTVPVELKAFPADSVNQYIITSSLVPDSKYSGSKGRLFDRVFVQKDEFLPGKKETKK